MEEKTIERINKEYVTVYVAEDGTEFTNKEQCIKYDEKAETVVRARFRNRFGVEPDGEISADSLYHMDCCYDDYFLCIELKDQEDLDTLNMFLQYGYCNDKVFTLKDLGKKHIFMALSCEDGIYYCGTEDEVRAMFDWNLKTILNNSHTHCKDCKHYNAEIKLCDGTDAYRSEEPTADYEKDISDCGACYKFIEKEN